MGGSYRRIKQNSTLVVVVVAVEVEVEVESGKKIKGIDKVNKINDTLHDRIR